MVILRFAYYYQITSVFSQVNGMKVTVEGIFKIELPLFGRSNVNVY